MKKKFRSGLRHAALSTAGMVNSLTGRSLTHSQASVVQVANFHHLYPREVDGFKRFLAWFQQHFKTVSYSQAVKLIQSGRISSAVGAVTFDDGLKSVVGASEILAENGVSACFFINPAIIGETDTDRQNKFCLAARMRYESTEFVSWDDVDRMRDLGHEIGNHTFTHPELSTLTSQQIDDEIGAAGKLLREHGCEPAHFAWPFGKFHHLGPTAAASLATSGLKSCASGHRGAHAPHQAETVTLPCVRRDNLEAGWPLTHIDYLLARNARNPIGPRQWWPAEWKRNLEPGHEY